MDTETVEGMPGQGSRRRQYAGRRFVCATAITSMSSATTT
jgi:hypothetical protein